MISHFEWSDLVQWLLMMVVSIQVENLKRLFFVCAGVRMQRDSQQRRRISSVEGLSFAEQQMMERIMVGVVVWYMYLSSS